MSTIPVKISYKNDLRRISIDTDTTFQALKDTISKLFHIPTPDVPHMEIQYKDDEGDMIVMCTDIELKEAFYLVKESSTPALRLTLEINSSKGTVSNNAKVESTVETPVESKTPEEPPKQETTNEPEFPSPPSSEPSLCTRVKELIRTGKYEDLVKARQILLSEYQNSPEYYHCRARVESLLGNSQGSIECIKQAIQYGLTNIEQLLQDPHLLNVQNLEEFTSLIADLISGANVTNTNTTSNTTSNKTPNTNSNTTAPNPEPKSLEKELEEFVIPPLTQTTRQLQSWGNWMWNVTNQLLFRNNRYAAELKSLEEMGWKDRNACLRALDESNGDISTAVLILIDSEAK
jgi:hypothetical protein